MADVVLDSGPLAEFLSQYFGEASHGSSRFQECKELSEAGAKAINSVLATFVVGYPPKSYVVASTFAFTEIIRKWDHFRKKGILRIEPYQFRAFLDQPPDWFLVAAVDATLVPFYCQLPAQVGNDNVEWTDALHVATALSRNEENRPKCGLVTTDQVIVRIPAIRAECM